MYNGSSGEEANRKFSLGLDNTGNTEVNLDMRSMIVPVQSKEFMLPEFDGKTTSESRTNISSNFVSREGARTKS